MAYQKPPQLLERDEAQEEANAAAVEETPAPEAGTTAESVQEPEASSDPFVGKIILNKDAGIYAEIARLEREDEDFRQNLNTYLGRKAKRQYEPELERLRAELENERTMRRKYEFQNMEPSAIEERFRTDPQFARDYAEAVHGGGVDVNEVMEGVQTRLAIDSEIDRALHAGVGRDRIQMYEQWIQGGAFDVDPNTKQPLSPMQSMLWFSNVVNQDINGVTQWRNTQAVLKQQPVPAATQPVAEVPAQVEAPAEKKATAPKPNTRLTEASPDMSASNGNGARVGAMAYSEFKQLPPTEWRRMGFTSGADIERALRDGRLYRD